MTHLITGVRRRQSADQRFSLGGNRPNPTFRKPEPAFKPQNAAIPLSSAKGQTGITTNAP
jgi:hypothetical protein